MSVSRCLSVILSIRILHYQRKKVERKRGTRIRVKERNTLE